MTVHSSPRSIFSSPAVSWSVNSTRSPISSAASQRLSIGDRSGRIFTNVGSISNHCAHRMRNRATAVRELESTAMDRMAVAGRWLSSATDATGPFDATAMPGTTR